MTLLPPTSAFHLRLSACLFGSVLHFLVPSISFFMVPSSLLLLCYLTDSTCIYAEVNFIISGFSTTHKLDEKYWETVYLEVNLKGIRIRMKFVAPHLSDNPNYTSGHTHNHINIYRLLHRLKFIHICIYLPMVNSQPYTFLSYLPTPPLGNKVNF